MRHVSCACESEVRSAGRRTFPSQLPSHSVGVVRLHCALCRDFLKNAPHIITRHKKFYREFVSLLESETTWFENKHS